MTDDYQQTPVVRLGISSCLLGEKVRFNGGHKRDPFLVDIFGKYVDWVPVCPEVEVGMGTPRDTVRLIQIENTIRMISKKDVDFTDAVQAYTDRRTGELSGERLSGYVLKSGSPSCGPERVRIYFENGMPGFKGSGLFADGLMKRYPHMPVEDEGRLNDARLRENFISRVFAYHRWQQLCDTGLNRSKLMRFHEVHKYQLMAHNQEGMRRLGRLLGSSRKNDDVNKLADSYLDEFTAIMKRPPSIRNHTNTLQHMAGYVSDQLDAGDREELTEVIHLYRLERLPLIVPLVLLRHYVRKCDTPYLKDQVYLNPHPDELMLLNQL